MRICLWLSSNALKERSTMAQQLIKVDLLLQELKNVEWDTLGTYLGLSQSEIREIESNHQNTGRRRIVITRCAYAQGRVKRLSPSIYLFVCVCVCVSSKNTAVCCLTARKSPRNSSLPLGLAIYFLRKMPRKPDESSVECYGHGFLIAARPRGV